MFFNLTLISLNVNTSLKSKSKSHKQFLGDNSQGIVETYMPPILVPSSAKLIAKQILVIAKLKGRKYFILRVFVCDINRPSKELPVKS